jgi:rRNA processing protein Krr1/Pno1
VKAGGSDDPKELSRSVKFPREGEGNLIKFEGNKDVVDKMIDTIQTIVAHRESQVVETVDIPTEKHRSLVGRGGETRKALETKFNVTIEIPRLGNSQTGVRITGQPVEVETAKEHILSLVKEEEGETVYVPKNLHHAITDNGQIFRRLRNDHQVTVDHMGHKIPPKSAVPSNTRANGGALPLITDDQASSDTFSWSVFNLSGSNVDGEIPWILRGSPENVAKAKASLTAALEQARKNTHIGYLVLPDPRAYRYVVGQGGSKVNSIRKASGCKITVPKDQAKGEAIEITGSAEGVEKAKELVLQAVKEGGNARNGNRT